MDANNLNGLVAGVCFVAIGIFALAGFAWNIRCGVPAYVELLRAHYKRIDNPYADDERGLWTLAVAKLGGTVGLGIVLLIGGALVIAIAAG